MLPDDASPAERTQMRTYLGIDLPIHVQYLRYMQNLFKGDMGTSFFYYRPVNEVFAERIPATVRLGVSAFALAVIMGIPLGVLAAIRRNTPFDRLTMTASIAGYTVPNFVFGILMILLFSLALRVLPSGGYGGLKNYIMPVTALAVGPMASIARLTRSSMLDVLRQDYMYSARAKGVPEPVVIVKHGLRNALVPVITIIGLQVGRLIGGAVVVETVFAWPGVGSLIVFGATKRDFPILQFGVLLVGAAVVLANTLVDISYALLDPRIRDAT
jgi:peptide/nickel transport system permease protein